MTYPAFRRYLVLPLVCSGTLSLGVFLAADVPESRDARPVGQAGGGAASPSTVEFYVIGGDGQPVSDLKPEEVTLRVGGKDRKIESLELKRFAAGGAPGTAAASTAAAPYATNVGVKTGAPSRVFFFVILDQSVRPGDERPIHAMIEKLMSSLAPTDRVGLLTAPNATVQIPPTTDHARVRKSLPIITGQRPGSSSAGDRNCRTRDSLVALRNSLASVQSEDGLATVVFFASALEQAAAPTASLDNTGCVVSTDLFTNVARAAASARAYISVVQAEESVSARSEGLETLASVVGGGQVLPLVSSGDPMARIVRETGAYYVAKFRPESGDRVGAASRLEVRVSRSGVHARTYGEYAFRPGGAAAGGGAPGNAREMLKTTAAYPDLPVRLHASVSRDKGEDLKVLVLAEPADPSVKLKEAAIGVGDLTQMQTMAVPDAQLGTRPISTTLPLPNKPGSYRVRFAAIDSSGKAGAVEFPVEIQLVSAGPLKMSDLLFGFQRDGKFALAMEFKDQPAIIAVMEIYGAITAPVSGRMEIAATADGPALATAELGSQTTGDPERNSILSQIPIAALKPGDYVVRAFLKMGDGPEGKVVRTLRKVQ